MFREKDAEFKVRQKYNFDKCHKVRESSVLPDDTEVWVTTGPRTESEPVRGTITTSTGSPRSYTVEVPSGETRRNRSHIRVVPDTIPSDTPEPNIPSTPQTETPRHITICSQTNTAVTKPDY